jgi:hypothetical protein
VGITMMGKSESFFIAMARCASCSLTSFCTCSVEVEKVGEEGERCGFYNKKTGWGCVHHGDAYIFNLQPQYYDYRNTEEVFIPNAGTPIRFYLCEFKSFITDGASPC